MTGSVLGGEGVTDDDEEKEILNSSHDEKLIQYGKQENTSSPDSQNKLTKKLSNNLNYLPAPIKLPTPTTTTTSQPQLRQNTTSLRHSAYGYAPLFSGD